MRAFGFQAKLVLLLGIFILGFVIATGFLFASLDRVKVNGPIYADLKQSYDLLADILPPPEYLIEDYLTSLQMFGATPEELPKLVETSQRLAKEFTDRHQYWQTNLRNQSFRAIIDQKTYPAGKKFLDIMAADYVPAIQQGDQDLARSALAALTAAYTEHRQGIDELVSASTAATATLEEDASRLILMLTILAAAIAAVCLAACLVFAFMIIRSVMRQLGGDPTVAANVVKVVAAGDLTMKIPLRTGDTHSLLFAFAAMVGGLRGNLLAVAAASGKLETASHELDRRMHQTGEDVSGINQGIELVNAHAVNQSASVTEASASIDQILKNLHMLNNLIEEQAANVTQSSSSIEEMISNIQSVNGSVEQMGQAFNQLQVSSDDGQTKLTNVVDSISHIAAESERLQLANATINSIAAQTNLLAMNAAIEAAHAGSAGQGFAVVADEIRKLAELASVQSKEISQNIRTIRGFIQAGAATSNLADQSYKATMAQIQLLGRFNDQIKQAMNEQTQGSQQILQAVQQINDITFRVRDGSAEMVQGGQVIRDEMRKLLTESEEVRLKSGELTAGTQRVAAVVAEVHEIGEDTLLLSGDLAAQVSQFTL